MSSGPDYLRDYDLLGCGPGDDRATIERAWRRAVSALHPDRGGPDVEARSEQLSEVTAAYRRLSKFAELHGRLPGEPPPDGANGIRQPAVVALQPVARRSGLGWLWFVPVAALLGWALVADESGPAEPRAVAAPVPGSSAPAFGDAGLPVEKALRLGDGRQQVLAVAGAPLEVTGTELETHWHYGPSFIQLRAGRVVGWYSSPMRPLPVETERPPAAP